MNTRCSKFVNRICEKNEVSRKAGMVKLNNREVFPLI